MRLIRRTSERAQDDSNTARRILVADDDPSIATLIQVTLKDPRYEIVAVKNGLEALKEFEGNKFDVVILDLTIRGGMGGQETIQTLLKIDPAVKAIAMSGYVHDPVILEPERHGFKGALAKPFEIGKLRELLTRIMGRK